MKTIRHCGIVCIRTLFVLTFFIAGLAGQGFSAEPGSAATVALLPFQTNAASDISWAARGTLKMLRARLALKKQVLVLPPAASPAVSSGTQPMKAADILSHAGKTGADYIITGIITEFGNAFSIDARVYQIKDQTFLTFFGQSESSDTFIKAVDLLAAKINKKVFKRTTQAYERFEKEKKVSTEDLRRMNPERMMPPKGLSPETDKPWWKVW